MSQLISDKVSINKSAQHIFDFLCNFNNYQQLMPEQVVDWSSNEMEGTFTIKNMATLGLLIQEKVAPSKVKLIKTQAPFELDLTCNIEPIDDNNCNLQIVLNADMNPFLKMVAEKPLTNFINILVANCKKVNA